ncbi:protein NONRESPONDING TO OXYLIPINS 2, mitochondrial-like isoform X2 [Vicia villosa]|uniref:protein NONRESPONDING TO OXYLIPINS 2, mitochondrial-like isoform X2 n=1 Tax=Vicia villosa TaxID=3911 RepID=UPI00273C13BC|nr:protein NONRESPONDING TO OXYLIPINS 2, mitochondrial-like isoform X2 [Vicia villosa]
MASAFCKSAARVASSSFANRSRTFAQKPSTPLLFSSQVPRVSRILSVVGSVESLMPLHSAIANARLTSNIASDSTCWSWLSQDFAVPR